MSVQPPEAQGTPTRQFKGVWITASVWDHSELSLAEKFLLAEVDSLCGRGTACFASNEYLAKRLRVTPTYMNNLLARLTADGYLVRLHFNGHTTLRCVVPSLSSDPDAAQKLLDKHGTTAQGVSLNKNVKANESRERRVNKKIRAGLTKNIEKGFQGSQFCEPEISNKRDTKKETPTTPQAVPSKDPASPLKQVVVVVSSGASEEGTESEANVHPRLTKEFGLNRAQVGELASYRLDIVLDKAALTRSEPRRNAAAFLMKALSEDYQWPVAIRKAPATKRAPEPAAVPEEPPPPAKWTEEKALWHSAGDDERRRWLQHDKVRMWAPKGSNEPGPLFWSALRELMQEASSALETAAA